MSTMHWASPATILMRWNAAVSSHCSGSTGRSAPVMVMSKTWAEVMLGVEVVMPVARAPTPPEIHPGQASRRDWGLRHHPPPLVACPRMHLVDWLMSDPGNGARIRMQCAVSAKNFHAWHPSSTWSMQICLHWQGEPTTPGPNSPKTSPKTCMSLTPHSMGMSVTNPIVRLHPTWTNPAWPGATNACELDSNAMLRSTRPAVPRWAQRSWA
mmetsp:Transcript_23383/g.56840  ORF Transcript_23383/g.56840 Transcript_23383/m.56840 type:complete len:211 (+) Transcript_23383:1140-1772(+)